MGAILDRVEISQERINVGFIISPEELLLEALYIQMELTCPNIMSHNPTELGCKRRSTQSAPE